MIARLWPLFRRNVRLYSDAVKIRGTMLLTTTVVFLLARRQSFTDLFSGVIQCGAFTMPLTWLFLVMSPLMVVGDAATRLFKVEYPLVSHVSLRVYLATIQVLVAASDLAFWGVWFVLASGWQALGFSLTVLLLTIVITEAYSLAQLFAGPIAALLGSLGLLIITVACNHFPLLSALMASRYPQVSWPQTLLALVLVAVAAFFSTTQLYQLDFMRTDAR
ncbi:hypothetical protein ACFQ3L_04435 [Lacticaseibacillus jixianensis]|uniref:ABC-2 type transporter domain-containing protein n=3 Tax=Lacticaseibacillus TaxID=2759736 RepID=A0A0R1QRG9_9LACO|nr:hypothetical protein [Lacticaseibacillus jixianensis]KRL47325.1 hypothetical protein FD01_GL000326 [Lacticaseibacillus manihotivorans DSM 13343 = JCM 12514]